MILDGVYKSAVSLAVYSSSSTSSNVCTLVRAIKKFHAFLVFSFFSTLRSIYFVAVVYKDKELGSYKESVHLTVFEMDSQPPSENRKSSNNSIMMKQTDRRSKNKKAHTRIF